MTLNLCEPCCSPSEAARGKDSYKQAKLLILCEIANATGGIEIEGNTGCIPCCDPSRYARGNESFRQSVLIVLCQWLSNSLILEE